MQINPSLSLRKEIYSNYELQTKFVIYFFSGIGHLHSSTHRLTSPYKWKLCRFDPQNDGALYGVLPFLIIKFLIT